MPPTAWHGAEAQGAMAPPPPRTSFTVAKVGGIEPASKVAPLGTHGGAALPSEPAIPKAPPRRVGSSMWPGQPARQASRTIAAAVAKLRHLMMHMLEVRDHPRAARWRSGFESGVLPGVVDGRPRDRAQASVEVRRQVGIPELAHRSGAGLAGESVRVPLHPQGIHQVVKILVDRSIGRSGRRSGALVDTVDRPIRGPIR